MLRSNLPWPIYLLHFLLLLLDLSILVVIILSRIGNLILKHLDELVKHDRQDRSNRRSSPVDPMFLVKDTRDDAWPETACGIEGTARVVNAYKLGDEERKTDADGGDECRWREER